MFQVHVGFLDACCWFQGALKWAFVQKPVKNFVLDITPIRAMELCSQIASEAGGFLLLQDNP